MRRGALIAGAALAACAPQPAGAATAWQPPTFTTASHGGWHTAIANAPGYKDRSGDFRLAGAANGTVTLAFQGAQRDAGDVGTPIDRWPVVALTPSGQVRRLPTLPVHELSALAALPGGRLLGIGFQVPGHRTGWVTARTTAAGPWRIAALRGLPAADDLPPLTPTEAGLRLRLGGGNGRPARLADLGAAPSLAPLRSGAATATMAESETSWQPDGSALFAVGAAAADGAPATPPSIAVLGPAGERRAPVAGPAPLAALQAAGDGVHLAVAGVGGATLHSDDQAWGTPVGAVGTTDAVPTLVPLAEAAGARANHVRVALLPGGGAIVTWLDRGTAGPYVVDGRPRFAALGPAGAITARGALSASTSARGLELTPTPAGVVATWTERGPDDARNLQRVALLDGHRARLLPAPPGRPLAFWAGAAAETAVTTAGRTLALTFVDGTSGRLRVAWRQLGI